MADQFEILAKVKLDTSDIQSQLQKVQIKDLNVGSGLQDQNIKIGADTSEFELSISVANAIMREFMEIAGKMVDQVYELDSAMTEFKKVSDLRGSALDTYVEQLGELGQVTARTTSEMVDAATSFKKSGFTDEQAKDLALVATAYQNVADEAISAGDSANFIISQMKAFNIEAEDSMHIIDAVNEVSNNFAVSSADLATNIGKASAALSIGGVTYEETLGMMTAITEINRNGAKSARGLVSVQSRYNQILDETSSTGQKLIDFYDKYNIQLYDQDGQLRSLWDTLYDLSQIWDTLDENEQKYFLNIQAGANQSVQLGALMSNFGTAIEATNTALNSSGSAMEENEAYMESLEAKTNLLKADFQTLANDVISKDLVSGVLGLGSSFLKLADSEAGVAAIQATLSGGLAMSTTALLQASKIVPALTSSFQSLGSIIGGVGTSLSAAAPAMMGIFGVILGLIYHADSVEKEALDSYDKLLERVKERANSIVETRASIADNNEILDLINKYQTLRTEMQDTSLNSEDLAVKTQELDEVRTLLSEKTNGAIGSEQEYGQQLDNTIAKLEILTQAEQDKMAARLASDLATGASDYTNALEHRAYLLQRLGQLQEQQANEASVLWGENSVELSQYYQDVQNLADTLSQDNIWTHPWDLDLYLQQVDRLKQYYLDITGKAPASVKEMASELKSYDLEGYLAGVATEYDNVSTEIASVQTELDDTTSAINAHNDAMMYLVATGYKTVEEAAKELGISTDDVLRKLESWRQQNSSLISDSDAFSVSINSQVDALLSLEDELANAQIALQAYQDALAGGDRGDLADTLEGIFSQIQEDVSAGYINTKQQEEFFKLIFNPEGLEQYGADITSRLSTINSEWFQALFNTEEGATLGTNLLSLVAGYADEAGNYVDSATGDLIASFTEVDGELQLQSLDLEALQESWGLSDTIITAIADDLRGMGYDIAPTRGEILGLAQDMDALKISADGVQTIDVSAFIQRLVEAGRTRDEIYLLVDSLDTLSGVELDMSGIDGEIHDVIDSSLEAQQELDTLGDKEPEPTADIDNDALESGVQQSSSDIDTLGRKSATPKATLDYSGVRSGVSSAHSLLRSINGTAAHTYIYTHTIQASAEGSDSHPGGLTLVNEEGPELIKEGDEARIAGGGQPTVTNIKRGATVYTAEETEDILHGTKIGNGIKALAAGTVSNPFGLRIPKPTGSSSSGSSGGSSGYSSYGSSKGSSGYSSYASTYTAKNSGSKSSSTKDSELERHKNIIALLEAEYSLLEAQGASTEELDKKARQIGDAYQAENAYLKTTSSYLDNDAEVVKQVVNNTEQWYQWQDKISQKIESDYSDIVSLLESEYSLMEAQGASADELTKKAREIQNAYHELNNFLRSTDEYLRGDAEILKKISQNSQQWYSWQEKIKQEIIEATEYYKKAQSYLSGQLNLMEKQGVSVEQQIDKIKEYQAGLQSEAQRLQLILKNANQLGLTGEDMLDILTKINSLGEEWADWQDKIVSLTFEKQRDALLLLQSSMVDYYKEQQNAIDAQIEGLQQNNDALQDQITLQEKLDALARARQQKVMVYKDGRWQYVSDMDAVAQASADLAQYQGQLKLEQQIAELEKEKEELQKLSDSWSNFTADYERTQNEWLIQQQLGINTTLDGWERLVSGAEKWANRYTQLMGQIAPDSNTTRPADFYGTASGSLPYNANLDYAALILQAKTYDEALKWAAYRDAKLAGENLLERWGGSSKFLERWVKEHSHASGTLSAPGGLSLVGERGAELRVLGSGDGIIPNNLTKNLMAWGQFTPTQYATQAANFGGMNMNVTIQALNLPNVSDGTSFVDYIRNNMFGQVMNIVH